jgi:hypothetical protein
MRVVPCRALAPPARSKPPTATICTWRGADGEMAATSKRGEEERAEGRGRGREKVWGTLMLTNFSHPPNRVQLKIVSLLILVM